MKKITVVLIKGEPLEYEGDCVQAQYDECDRKSGFMKICKEQIKVTPEYSWTGRFIRDWECTSFEQVALIRTSNIERIELKDISQ